MHLKLSVFCLFFISALACAHEKACEENLNSAISAEQQELELDAEQSRKETFLSMVEVLRHHPEEEPSVRIMDEFQTRFGKQHSILREHNRTWVSLYDANTQAPQGDPRWFAMIANSIATARMFGYEKDGDHFFRIPDADFLNHVSDAVNAHLDADNKFSLKFYKADGKVDSRVYLKNYSQGKLPWGSLHDRFYHGPDAFIPTPVQLLSFRQIEALFDFYGFLTKKKRSYVKRLFIERILSAVLDQEAAHIDASLGNFVFHLAARLSVIPTNSMYSHYQKLSEAEARTKAYELGYESLTDLGASPFNFLENIFINRRIRGLHFFTYGLDEIHEVFGEYAEVKRKNDPAFTQGLYNLSEEEFFRLFEEKRRLVDEIAHRGL